MTEKMIYALLRLDKTAKKKIAGFERRLTKTASFAFGDTWAQIEAMLDIIEEKQRFVKALEVVDTLKKGLTEEENEILMKKASGMRCADMAYDMGFCLKTMYRKIESALRAAENVLFLLGYDSERAEKTFGEFLYDYDTEEEEACVA